MGLYGSKKLDYDYFKKDLGATICISYCMHFGFNKNKNGYPPVDR
jgi:hypothetical protein